MESALIFIAILGAPQFAGGLETSERRDLRGCSSTWPGGDRE